MADLDLDRLEALAKAATPGPWWGGGSNRRRDSIGLVGRTSDRGTGNAIAVLNGIGMDRVADAEFIAAAREGVPTLIAEVRGLRRDHDSALAIIEHRDAMVAGLAAERDALAAKVRALAARFDGFAEASISVPDSELYKVIATEIRKTLEVEP